jgi:hypothetical protein
MWLVLRHEDRTDQWRTIMNTTKSKVSQDDIARRAYEIWQERGCPPGDGSEDWQAAEAELLGGSVGRNGSTQDRGLTWWDRVRQRITGRDQ